MTSQAALVFSCVFILGWKASVRCWYPPKTAVLSTFFFKLETQITERQYLWQATEFNVLSKWDLGLNGPSYALKAMRSAHHFGPNKGYHHVVAFLTIAHRNPLIKWALCETSYKRACYTIVGSNNNTRRGQLSKRKPVTQGGVRGFEGGGGGEAAKRELRGCRKSTRACVANCGINWKRGNGWE